MNFMHEGGYGMWAILIVAVAAVVVALIKRTSAGGRFSLYGSVGCLIFGGLGFASGLYCTVAAASRVPLPRSPELLMVGIRESSNNLIFGSALAAVLVILSMVLNRWSPARD